MPVDAKVAAILRATWPDLPMPGADHAATAFEHAGAGRGKGAVQARRNGVQTLDLDLEYAASAGGETGADDGIVGGGRDHIRHWAFPLG